ncbi:lytic transglycosylase domain-containing protein [Pseudoxanthomonas winnipegensis]|uniref:Lytic transglycosylase domain-containing protein n=1 Tax=Pseudoxanthomonas winnipegensis TaxID=2480810 RepID=A0A4Q8LFW4_9GAMM|nr:lytic transglycosylase domain-containing protein [Pseudoxanthomonas winnipegensis]TAA28320.1 lytic transglycosylase domain-containing protein [Pseudoxanthomonas winnipegensis]
MKGLLRLGMIAVALPASAGTLYKCVGADGIPAYVSKRVSGATCTVVSQYRAEPARRVQASAPTHRPPASAAPAAIVPPSVESRPSTAIVPAAPPPPTAAVARPAAVPPRRVVSGQVYSFIKDGVRNYTSARPRGLASAEVRTIHYSFIETCYACGNPTLNFGAVRLNTVAYSSEIAAAAREFGVEEAIVRAIIHAESSYNPLALSRAGAMGLMQLMPATARRFGVDDAYNATQNIRGGVQYLAWLLKRYQGNLTLAAAGYNAGEGAVDRNGGVPPYAETQRYVQRVGVLAERYRANLGTIGLR